MLIFNLYFWKAMSVGFIFFRASSDISFLNFPSAVWFDAKSWDSDSYIQSMGRWSRKTWAWFWHWQTCMGQAISNVSPYLILKLSIFHDTFNMEKIWSGCAYLIDWFLRNRTDYAYSYDDAIWDGRIFKLVVSIEMKKRFKWLNNFQTRSTSWHTVILWGYVLVLVLAFFSYYCLF